jgi:hypothetical protein
MAPTLPPRHARERRAYRLELHLTAAERAALVERAGATTCPSLAAYVREVALGRMPAAAIPAVNRDTAREPIRVGTNLNQIAYQLNSGNVATVELGRRLSGELAQVAELLRRLRLDLASAR